MGVAGVVQPAQQYPPFGRFDVVALVVAVTDAVGVAMIGGAVVGGAGVATFCVC
jgi:hypothetical protein